MSNRQAPRSFNTVKQSNREERRRRRRKGRVVLLSIFLVIIALLLSLLILIICSIVDVVSPESSGPGADENNSSDNGSGETDYTTFTKSSSDISKGVLLIVNPDRYFDPSTATELVVISEHIQKNNGIDPVYSVADPSWKLNKEALNAFNAMLGRYYELSGDDTVKISSAYRSYSDQENSSSTTTPGHSDHHTGYCIALRTRSGGYLEKDHWIYENAHKYGYIMRYPEEKKEFTQVGGYEYCFRYVGVAHATYIKENNLCLEEYTELLKTNYTDRHLKIDGADGNQYEVYYVPKSSGDITQIRVPSQYESVISGDNIGGFIVTVNLDAPNA